jgi:predicted RNA-binding Zn ribbon-like protein
MARKNWRFLLRSDSVALNFTATVAGPRPRPHGTDRLTEPALLERWFCEAQLPPLAQPLSEAGLEKAISLRESIFQVAASRLTAATILSADIERINTAARAGFPPVRLGADGQSRVPPEHTRLDELLGLIARDAIDIFTGPYHDRIRKCASPRCQILFVDRSPSGNRRWCAMSPCGDQESARVYRRRKKERVAA